MKKFDILVAGELNPDLILTDPNLEPRFGQEEVLVKSVGLTIGSSSAIFACGAAKLGLHVAFIGVVGDDYFGEFMRHGLEECGVDTSSIIIDTGQETGLSVILNRGTDRAILTHMGAIGSLSVEQIPSNLLRSTRHLHIGSYFLQTKLQIGLDDLFSQAHALNITTSLDTNWSPSGEWSRVGRLLEKTDVFFPNEVEAKAVSGREQLLAAVRHLSKTLSLIVVKRGAQGALVSNAVDIHCVSAPSFDVVDTVGAGDNFDAGFLYGYLHGWDALESLKLAVSCGSLSTREQGGTAGQATLEEALALVDKIHKTDCV
jgi:sugar/nucleoside kinase (ribokinase family)